MNLVNCLQILLCSILLSCNTSRESSKYQLSDGYYKSNLFYNQKNTLYVDNSEDTIAIYLLSGKTGNIDTQRLARKAFPQITSDLPLKVAMFKQAGFDIDFLTIPFKYRPVQQNFPPQFNTNLNGALYLGYRSDIYQMSYAKTPLKNFARRTQHYGLSVGLFTGLGGTIMNPSVTSDQLTSEYDGVVWSKGIAGIIGVNNFTIGLAAGYDHLLDKNRRIWLYQGKCWLGLAFGLNIN